MQNTEFLKAIPSLDKIMQMWLRTYCPFHTQAESVLLGQSPHDAQEGSGLASEAEKKTKAQKLTMVHQLNKKNGKPREQLDLNRCSQGGYPQQNLELLDAVLNNKLLENWKTLLLQCSLFVQKGKRD